MAKTPALPIWTVGDFPSVVNWFEASRRIPTAVQPAFGIVPNGVVPGAGPKANAFFNPNMTYYNNAPVGFPSLYLNMPTNRYSFGIQGLMNFRNNSGARG